MTAESGIAPDRAPDRSILVVDDDATLRRLLTRQIERLGYHARGAGTLSEALATLETYRPDLILLDQKLPDATGTDHLPELSDHCPVVVLTAYGSVDQAVGAVKAGAADYLAKPISPKMLELAVSRTIEAEQLRNEVGFLRREARSRERVDLIGESSRMVELRERAHMLAPEDMPVLIHGESGVGKATLARFIHESGPRAQAGFAEPQSSREDSGNLLDELFGAAEPGLFELVRGGTLYLSRIERMPQVVQRRLATALETGVFSRRGSPRVSPLQVRVIASSGQNMADLAGPSGLVPELYYLLSGLWLEVPLLRDRKRDIPDLAEHFMSRRRFALGEEKRFAKKTLDLLQNWNWPGNLRELRNVVERGVILSGTSRIILPRHVELGEQVAVPRDAEDQISVADEPSLDELRDRYLGLLLQRHDNNRRVVAEILGISERSLYRVLSQSRDVGNE